MTDNELESFKTEINLVELASIYGYELDKKESSRFSISMRHPDGDKIVVATAQDGHNIFFSARENRNGTVIDFIMYRESVNLGGARKILRKYLVPGYLHDRSSVHYKPETSSQEQIDLHTKWLKMKPYNNHGYLESRGITPETIATFTDWIRLDDHNNICFRHSDLRGLTGWEIKNKGFTGFSGGGKKALFGCKIGTPELVVVTESAIDAMSYYQMNKRSGLYLSFAGAISHEQWELLVQVVNRYPEVVIATDNDDRGEKYAEQILQLHSGSIRDCPPIGKDWNDTLKNRKAKQ